MIKVQDGIEENNKESQYIELLISVYNNYFSYNKFLIRYLFEIKNTFFKF
jgi:hypothetical protein